MPSPFFNRNEPDRQQEYKGWKFIAKTEQAGRDLMALIDKIAASKNPHAIPESANFGTINHSDFKGISYLSIPAHITDIGGCAFAKNKDLQHVEVLGYARLGQDCFNGSNVEQVDISKVFQIDKFCFWHCDNLTDLYMPSLQTAKTRSIGRCKNLETVYAPRLHKFEKLIYDCQNMKTMNIGGDNGYEYDNGEEKNRFDITTIQKCPNLETLVVSPKSHRAFGRYIAPNELQTILCENMAHNLVVEFGSGSATKPDEYHIPELTAEDKPAAPAIIIDTETKVHLGNGWQCIYRYKTTMEALCNIFENHLPLPAGNTKTELSKFQDLITIHLPSYIVTIPEYCFSQCYELKLIRGDGEDLVIGDHAFYCASELGTVSFPNAHTAQADAFNGAGSNAPGTMFDLSRLIYASSRAFWQTGATELNLPNLQHAAQNSIEENAYLEELNIGNANIDFLSVCSNPKLEKKDIITAPGGIINPFAFYKNGR